MCNCKKNTQANPVKQVIKGKVAKKNQNMQEKTSKPVIKRIIFKNHH